MNIINQYGKVPPQAHDLERAILGAIMLDRDAFDKVSGILKPESFYSDQHKYIFSSMVDMSKKNMPIDLLTVVEELRNKEKLEIVGGPSYVIKLTNEIISSANIETHARIIAQKFIQRELIRVSSEINSMAYEDGTDAFELMDYAEKNISEIGQKNIESGMICINDVLTDAIDKIEQWRSMDTSITGIPSGFKSIDQATRGWQNGNLIILAARPSVGKSAIALNIARNAANNDLKSVGVGIWSLEMKAVYMTLRMLSSESKTFLQRLLTGQLEEHEMKKIYTAADSLSKLDIFFDQSSKITTASLNRKAKRLKKYNNLGLIMIDYIQLMKGDSERGSRENEVSRISRELKEIAGELDVPVIGLSQLSRESGDKGISWEYGPPIRAIRESGAIEQDADDILMLWGPSDEDIARDPSLYGQRKLRIAKQRNGVLMTETLNFRNEIQLFEAFEKTNESLPSNWKPVASIPANRYEAENEEETPF